MSFSSATEGEDDDGSCRRRGRGRRRRRLQACENGSKRNNDFRLLRFRQS